MENKFSYAGKRVVVTGVASGIGEATARVVQGLGADVLSLDVREARVGTFLETNLASRDAIDAAIQSIGEPVHALFNCAGLAGPPFSTLALAFAMRDQRRSSRCSPRSSRSVDL
jgi:NAD(P)-dependent dehydrogenase (short-subunit alcohol dehydrogenase family)